MYAEGHHGLNALLYAPVAVITSLFASVELAITGAVLFVGVSSIPDFDRHCDSNWQKNEELRTHRSDLWTVIPIKHRGFTHTVWFAILTGFLGAGLAVIMTPIHNPTFVAMFGFAAASGGIIGHIIGDVFTPMGVKPFSPLIKKKYTLRLFTAKNKVANYGFLIIGGVALLAALGFGFTEVGIDLDNHVN